MTGGEAGCGSADSADENARTVGDVTVTEVTFVLQVGKKTLAEHFVK